MFTGLIEHVGTIRAWERHDRGARLVIDPGSWRHGARLGDSIAVHGCCLTVAIDPAVLHGALAFDLVPETLRLTAFERLHPGARVHLEPAATLATALGGHLVQGHVDGVGTVTSNSERGGEWRLALTPPANVLDALVPKGSVAIDGVSLTIASVDPPQRTIEIALIPTTLEKTTLGALRPGDPVNVEVDVIAKTVAHYVRHMVRPAPSRA